MKLSTLHLALLPTAAWAQLQSRGRGLRADDLPDLRVLEESLSMDSIYKPSGSKMSSKSAKPSPPEIPTLNECASGRPLKVPEQIRGKGRGAKTVKATLRMGVANYIGPSYNTPIRVYNGDTLGPTIRVYPGDDLEITLINDLELPLGNEMHNEYMKPNTTNLHTHGPHVSGESPGDNIFVRVDPGQTEVYRYHIGSDHMPGTMWYHPHFHGSTAIQTSTCIGQLIIEDPDDYPIPQQYKDMEEVQIHIMESDVNELLDIAEKSQDLLTNVEVTNCVTDEEFYFLINGQYRPVVTMEQDKWYRWRMLAGNPSTAVVMELEDGHDCELNLIAKDGIYLNEVPRKIDTIIMFTGHRADIAMRCHSVGQIKMVMLSNGDHDFDPEFTGQDIVSNLFGIPPTFWHCKEAQGDGPNVNCPELFSINVIKGEGHNDPDLEGFSVNPRPCYLADLTGSTAVSSLEVEPEGEFEIDFQIPPANPTGTGYAVNNVSWVNEETYLTEFPLGTVQQFVTLPSGAHPHHHHVNPFQIYHIDEPIDGTEVSEATRIWFQKGDWHDTLQYPRFLKNTSDFGRVLPPPFGYESTFGPPNFIASTIRFGVNSFSGHMVLHCHKLAHEDQGMMGQFDLQGEEGTIWEGSRVVDPLCVLPDETPASTMQTAPCALKNKAKCEEECKKAGEGCVEECIIDNCAFPYPNSNPV